MAKLYISSTYEDLQDHCEAAYKALRRLRHDVVAMEDYVATDERPLDACLADVAQCDVYVGIIGWRYGYVPPQDNPQGCSITELEYRKAVELQKPRLLFMVSDDAAWSPKFVDKGEAADRLKALRDELGTGRLASFFASQHELAELVTAAVVKWERGQPTQVAPANIEGLATTRLRAPGEERPLPDAPYPSARPPERSSAEPVPANSPKWHQDRRELGTFRPAWLFPATVGSVFSAVLLSMVPTSPGAAKEILTALALVTPLLAGLALSKQRPQPPWWTMPLSGALIGIVNLTALYVGTDTGPPVRWDRATFWLGVVGPLLAFAGYGLGQRPRINNWIARNLVGLFGPRHPKRVLKVERLLRIIEILLGLAAALLGISLAHGT